MGELEQLLAVSSQPLAKSNFLVIRTRSLKAAGEGLASACTEIAVNEISTDDARVLLIPHALMAIDRHRKVPLSRRREFGMTSCLGLLMAES